MPSNRELRQEAKRLRALAREVDRAAGGKYESHREDMAAASRERSAAGREVSPPPPVKDPARKAACRLDVRLFLKTYFPRRFFLEWCEDHQRAIAKIQHAEIEGGQFAFAMPRGSGKTAIAEGGAMHALLYGHRVFVVLIGSEHDAAKEMLASIKVEFETNDLLYEDFPEVCHFIRELDGINNRANGQTYNGVRTRIAWTDTRAVLPTVPGSPASGSRLRVVGITGRIRGMKATTAAGDSIRPDLVLVDDPQTDDSATSPPQNAKREAILSGAILGLAGPKKKIAAFVPCTVIAPGDLADRILDRQRHPVWQGERSRMVIAWPDRRDLWDKYIEMRRASFREGHRGEEANEFYAGNRAVMDAGAVLSWPQRFDADEASAIQNAMNLLCDRGQQAFDAEFQNDPKPVALAGQVEDLDADAIAAKINRCPRGVVPPDCSLLTVGIDVQELVIFYAVVGWSSSFSGAIVDYGTCPRQNSRYFRASDARPSLADVNPRHDVTARIYAGLGLTVPAVVGRPYPRQNGGELRVGLAMIDTGHKPDTVYAFCREHPLASLLMPFRGFGITAGKEPMSSWAIKPGERPGWHWRKRPTTGSGRGLHVIADTNHWKTFVADRWLTPPGGAGCLQLFGDEKNEHQLFADHMTSEFRVRTARTSGSAIEVDEWQSKPTRPDNHWWDCLVMATVGASVSGLTWSAAEALGETMRAKSPRKKIRLSDLYYAKHGGRPR